MATIKLTDSQVDQIKNDMDVKISMLEDSQINALAQKINGIVNLPFIKEDKELIVYAKIIKWIDRELYKLLPNEYYQLVADSTNGISKSEANRLEERLTPLINNVINIPFLTEDKEAKLISLILGIIINAMVTGFKLEEKEPVKG